MEKMKQGEKKKEFKRQLEKKQKRKFETGRENNAKSVTDKCKWTTCSVVSDHDWQMNKINNELFTRDADQGKGLAEMNQANSNWKLVYLCSYQ